MMSQIKLPGSEYQDDELPLSHFPSKVVYFDLSVGEEKPLIPDMQAHATAMTQVMEFDKYRSREAH